MTPGAETDWILRYLDGQFDASEKAAFEAWLAADERHRAQLAAIQAYWTYRPTPAEAERAERAFARMPIGGTQVQRATPGRQRHLPGRWAVAATLSLLLLAGYWLLRPTAEAGQQTVQTGAGDPREIVLPDGSHVWLDAHSQLRYATAFATDRRLSLEGTAYFEVVRDTAHPFVVSAGKGEVRVLGTKFSVQARVGEPDVVVVVTSGLISLGAQADNDPVRLSKDMLGLLNPAGQVKVERADPNYLSWLSGRLVFEQTPLPTIVAQLERLYGAEIRLQHPKLTSMTLTADVRREPLAQLLEKIAFTLDIAYKIENNTHTLTMKDPS